MPRCGRERRIAYRATSMKGQPESLIEGAILQARLEADLLYNLIVNVNLKVIERSQREYEYLFLLGYLSAEMHGNPTKDRVQLPRQYSFRTRF